MAIVLGKKCNAADVRFRPRPSGLYGCTALCVATFRQAPACLQSCALIASQPESQSCHRLDQRFPSLLVLIYKRLERTNTPKLANRAYEEAIDMHAGPKYMERRDIEVLLKSCFTRASILQSKKRGRVTNSAP